MILRFSEESKKIFFTFGDKNRISGRCTNVPHWNYTTPMENGCGISYRICSGSLLCFGKAAVHEGRRLFLVR
jgi:hypothetical protein